VAIVTSQELHLVPMFSAETQIDDAPMSGISYTRLYYAQFGISVHAWAFDNDLFNMRSELAPNNKLEGQTASEFLTKPNDVLSINGGYFEIERNAEARNTLTPSGLIIVDGREFSSINPKGGSGVLFTDNSNIGIVHVNYFHSDGTLNAVQAGQILVEPGGSIGVHKNDSNRQNRTAICLRPRMTIVIVVEGGVSLFELAQLLSSPVDKGGFGCNSALNLDGRPSTQAVFRSGKRDIRITGRWRVQNAVVIYKRT
jgi:exopolysaccharide biosynthesis protein